MKIYEQIKQGYDQEKDRIERVKQGISDYFYGKTKETPFMTIADNLPKVPMPDIPLRKCYICGELGEWDEHYVNEGDNINIKVPVCDKDWGELQEQEL